MTTLDKSLRNELARTVLAARALAEEAAGKALHALGVDEADAPGHLDNAGRTLRRKLRAQARQLGDREDAHEKGRYETRHLTEKVAYDHWHRLLFARFLAENDLLISPDHGVGISLDYCGDLAPTLGLKDGWEVAATFAARMLPQIFRADDPAGQVVFAPEDRVALRKKVTDLPRDIFLADDALGWVYQFWQAQRKDDVNASEKKIGADEISPVTQLFTEDYMVLFLLHNTLGAWWAGKKLSVISDQLSVAETEEACRQAVALPGVNWEYLRFVRPTDHGSRITDHSPWRPAAGTFDGWPKTAKELRVLDPCMGSGHFLVFELPILVAMRMAEEGLTREDAVLAVLRDNLYGLEIDPRCTQIAAFNLALAAWKLAGKYLDPPTLNLACCGLGINATREEWLALAPGEGFLMGQFYDLFKDAPILGSLINPARNIKTQHGVPVVGKIEEAVLQGLEKFRTSKDFEHEELGVTAQGITGAYRLLSGHYHLVATNVPFLTGIKYGAVLRTFIANNVEAGKANLATAMAMRTFSLCGDAGVSAFVCPQSWMYLKGYSDYRSFVLKAGKPRIIARLGDNSFFSASANGEAISLCIFSNTSYADRHIVAIDVMDQGSPNGKACAIGGADIALIAMEDQLANPMHAIAFQRIESSGAVGDIATAFCGVSTSDSPSFIRKFWELCPLPDGKGGWEFHHSTMSATAPYGGMEHVIFWERESGRLAQLAESVKHLNHNAQNWRRGKPNWGKQGVVISQMGDFVSSIYMGNIYDNNCTAIVPGNQALVPVLWAYCSSGALTENIRRMNQKRSVEVGTFLAASFDLAHWQKVAAEKYPNGLPKPHSDDPTQWLFYGHPNPAHPHGILNRPAPTDHRLLVTDHSLHVAVARLLGYRWPRHTGSEFPDCPALGPDGLEKLADADGIVCINAIKGEQPAAERLRALLAAAFGKDWSAKKQAELLAAVGCEGQSLDDWLRNGFFEQHCALFHQRPFIWHIWDGLRDGFSALVNYHRLTRSTLEKLTFTYLGDWIARQKAAVAEEEEGSDAKLAAAQELQSSLKKILEGEAPHDIFVRWKPIEKQPIGWDPDLNDGVRLNIRPFMTVPDVGRKGAGILRYAPKIKWDKDRGKDVESAPWYKLFKGDRINNHHLTLAVKKKARGL